MLDLAPYIRPGDGVWWGQASAEPEPLVNALLDQADAIGPVRAFTGMTLNARFAHGLPAALTMVSYGALGRLRGLRGLQVVPCNYSALPRLFAQGRLPGDVGLLQVSAPDASGMVSLGIGVEYVADALPHARTLIAEINHQMPATAGAPRLPLSAFAAIVETDRPLREVPGREPDAVDRAIAENVAGLVNDGDTLQIGVGTLPNAILSALSGRTDLGIHTGMITDGVIALIEQGAVTGAKKEIDQGLVITGAALGSATMYGRLHEFPVEFRPASYTHSPAVLAGLRSLVSVNSAIEVDLLGQAGAEMAGRAQLGAAGGQADFSRAASLTGARSVIALRSESRAGSTIVPTLSGGVVTTARADMDAVVTEHGAAVLTGCTVDERACRLIAVAAPRYRESLERSLAELKVAS
ncbi:MAG TPA: acetyl-CoA hydrolase/transferase C-terminal domain-containing protein [Trebonia sp.]|jgi:acyl-CoA hydrolase|nr:acetyl-CoA hydrolase/transferase C-terminal domain-containing protein [Trebonia sp.]